MAEFLHPSVRSQIIDNSIVFVTAQGQTMLYAAFKAERGPDNRPTLVTSESEFLFKFGNPNMRKYGQTAYNVVNWLRSGGVALCTRVLPCESGAAPEDGTAATYPAYILEVGTLMDTAVPANPATVRKTKVRVRTLGDGLNALIDAADEVKVRDDLSLQSVVLGTVGVPESDHYKYYPILVIRGESRGEYYNGFAPKIDLLDSFDEDYEHRTYQLSLLSTPSQVAEGPFTVSLYPEAQDRSGRSQFIVDVINGNSNYARVLFSEANYDAVCAYINATAANLKKLDILTLKERNVSTPETIHSAVTLAAGTADLTDYLPMGGGAEGLWTGPNALDAILFKAYSGSGDVITGDVNTFDTHFSSVLDKDLNPIDLILDGNVAQTVKVAMSNLAANRGDCMAMLDVGLTSSPAAAETYRKTSLTVNTFYSAIFAQDFVVSDEFQGNDMRVTSTYYLAQKIPQVDNDFGLHWPFVGPRRGTVTGFKSASWFPDESWKERLYKLKVNYLEKDSARGTVAFMSQSTSQVTNTALSDINHVRALLRMRRDVEAMTKDYRFEFNDPNTWQSLQYSLNQYLQQWVSNRCCTTIKGTVYASEYDKQSRILRVKVEMVFNGVIERIFIDLVVNR